MTCNFMECNRDQVYLPPPALQEWLPPADLVWLVIATAILDRALHHSTIINIKGNSHRLKEKVKAGLIQKCCIRRTMNQGVIFPMPQGVNFRILLTGNNRYILAL